MPKRHSLNSYRKNHIANQDMRRVDRYHGCSCGEVFACDVCSEALTKSVRDPGGPKGANGVALYAFPNHPPASHFRCPSCTRKKRKSAA